MSPQPTKKCGQPMWRSVKGDTALTVVRRVSHYDSFEKMLDAEGPENINPSSPREVQLAGIRRAGRAAARLRVVNGGPLVRLPMAEAA